MKKQIILLIALTPMLSSLCQNPFRIKIIDDETTDNIKDASVYINEIPSSDKKTDSYGVVVYNNFPSNKYVTINVKALGYKPQSVEAKGSPDYISDNFILIKLKRDTEMRKITVFGIVEDMNNQNVVNGKVILSFLGESLSAFTDSSGAYRFSIEKEKFNLVKSFIIQAEKGGCEKVKSNEDYYGAPVIKKNLKIKCFSDSDNKTEQDFYDKKILKFQNGKTYTRVEPGYPGSLVVEEKYGAAIFSTSTKVIGSGFYAIPIEINKRAQWLELEFSDINFSRSSNGGNTTILNAFLSTSPYYDPDSEIYRKLFETSDAAPLLRIPDFTIKRNVADYKEKTIYLIIMVRDAWDQDKLSLIINEPIMIQTSK